MKQSIILASMMLILSACSVGSISTVPREKPERPYARILTIFIDGGGNILRLDEATYESNIRLVFNNLDKLRYREQLEKTFARNITTTGTTIVQSSNIFEVNEDMNYQGFLQQVEKTNAQAILLVNLTAYWHEFDGNDEEPNASFNCYLIDLDTKEPVWLAQSTISGIFAGFETLNNKLARKIGNKLRNEGFTYGF